MCHPTPQNSHSESGRGDWIRTSDPLRPRQVRYQAALRPDAAIIPHGSTFWGNAPQAPYRRCGSQCFDSTVDSVKTVHAIGR
jgi:hypothetical protein